LIATADQARIEDFDVVDHVKQIVELFLEQVRAAARPEAVVRVRQADEATLIVDTLRRLDSSLAGRQRLLKVEADQVAVGRPDLLADDDGELRWRDLLRFQCAVDALVVGDGQMGQTAADGRLYNGFPLGERIK